LQKKEEALLVMSTDSSLFSISARKHPLHPYVPLCLTCGLILCSILSPSPMLLPSPPCPSCASPVLTTTSRAILLAKLDLELASLTKLHEEKVRLVQEERQRAWKEKRQEVELFPSLQGQLSGSSNSNIPAGSTKLQEHNYFYERRRAMDIAMGRRVEDDGQRRSRVLRLESKSTKGKGTGKKKKQKSNSSEVKGEPKTILSVLASGQHHVEVASGGEEEEVEPEEEEIEVEYDDDDDEGGGGGGDGPMPDPDDDGFARHATSFPPDAVPSTPATLGWWEQVNSGSKVQYIPKEDRTQSQFEIDDEEEQESSTTSRHIPGAAKEEIEKGSKGVGKAKKEKARKKAENPQEESQAL
jgi:hypothetical protein